MIISVICIIFVGGILMKEIKEVSKLRKKEEISEHHYSNNSFIPAR